MEGPKMEGWFTFIRKASLPIVAVFVHGFRGDVSDTWRDFKRVVDSDEALPADVALWGYPSGITSSPSIWNAANQLQTEIRVRLGSYHRLVLVGHSLGGLVIRAMVVQALRDGRIEDCDRIHHILTLGTPNDGQDLGALIKRFNKQLADLSMDDDTVAEIRDEWVNRVYNPDIRPGEERTKLRIPLTTILGLQDRVVRAASAASFFRDPPPEMVPGNHRSMKEPASADATVYRLFKRAVEAAEASRQPVVTDPTAGGGPHVLPCPPRPYPYTFAIQENSGWRAAERASLSDWWSNSSRPVLVLVSLVGLGKSTLAWMWLQADILRANGNPEPGTESPVNRRPHGVMWWSFDEPDGSFDEFVDEALAYTDGTGRPDRSDLTPRDKLTALLTNLQAHPFLLVLDGFERELVGHPVTPSGRDEVPSDALRRCAEPRVRTFLRNVQSLRGGSRVLLTSRLFPADLDGLAGTSREDIPPLPLGDAIAFLRAQGVQGPRGELASVCSAYGCHPMALRISSAVARDDPRAPNSVQAMRPTRHREAVAGGTIERALEVAYRSLSDSGQSVIGRLAVLRYPFSFDTALALSPCASEEDFTAVLADLRQRELVTFDSQQRQYDIHTLVQTYAYRQLPAATRTDAHRKAAEYFRRVVTSSTEKSATFADVIPSLQLYHHLLGASEWKEARQLLYDRLRPELYYRLGAYSVYAEAVAAFLSEDSLEVKGDLGPFAEAGIQNLFGNALCAVGRREDAEPAFRRAIELEPRFEADPTIAPEASVNVPVDLGNLGARCLLPAGCLKEAEDRICERIRYSQSLLDHLTDRVSFTKNNEAIGQSDLGYLYGICGRAEASERAFAVALEMFDNAQSQGIVHRLRGELALIRGELDLAWHCAEASYALAAEEGLARDLTHSECLRGGVEVAYAEREVDRSAAAERLKSATMQMEAATAHCYESNLIEAEPKIGIAWGHLHRVRGDFGEAEESFREAFRISELCGYRLSMADATYGLALVARDSGNLGSAGDQARESLALATCGPVGWRYELGVALAERLLNEIS